MTRWIACFFFCLVPLLEAWSKDARHIYVAPDGNDSWSGNLPEVAANRNDGPLASLQTAIERTRKSQKSPDPITEIIVRGGDYYLVDTIRLTEADSGTAQTPLRIAAYSGEFPRLIGGVLLKPKAPPQLGKPLVYDFDPGIVKAPPKRESRLGKNLPVFEVFAERRRLQLARWPNWNSEKPYGENWAYIAQTDKNRPTGFTALDLPKEIRKNIHKTGSIHVFTQPDWFDQILDIAGINATTREISFEQKPRYPFVPGARFALLNVEEALDAPGEWWFDSHTGQLYVLPWPGSDGTVTVSTLPTLLSIDKTRHLTIEGLTWEISTGDSIVINDCADVQFEGNVISLAGYQALTASTQEPLGISQNIIYSPGLGGMILSGGDRPSLTQSRIIASNNILTKTGERLKCYYPAFRISGVGITLEHNRIQDAPHSAIIFSGNEHLIQYNIIEDVAKETNDVGAIYAGRDWSSRGTKIMANIFRRIHGLQISKPGSQSSSLAWYTSADKAHAIYLDDLLEHTYILSNIMSNIGSSAIHIGGGGYTTIKDNYIFHSNIALFIANRTIFDAALKPLQQFRKFPIWRKRYPETINRENRDPVLPTGIIFTNNIIFDTKITYDLRRISIANSFNKNFFIRSTPSVSAIVIKEKESKKITEWERWQDLGFDSNSQVLTLKTNDQRNRYDQIKEKAGPHDTEKLEVITKSLPLLQFQLSEPPESFEVPLSP
ncbi:hypothetical protein OPIT5_05050 [Opitutaceae bacterium TAV5]|nr:hypothetical protein OPIT5_05050 [Opitutaceae bacterium TAV5]